VDRTVTCDQVVTLVDALDASEARCEAAVCLFGVCVDREDNWWKVLDALQGLEQSRVVTRLGCFPFPAATNDEDKKTKRRTSMHYVLDCANPEHERVAKDLCAAAARLPWQAFQNLVVAGKRVNMADGPLTWDALYAAAGEVSDGEVSNAPVVEVDFCGADVWECLKMTPIGGDAGVADAAGADAAGADAATSAEASVADAGAGADDAAAAATVVTPDATAAPAAASAPASAAAAAAAAAPADPAVENERRIFFMQHAARLNADLMRQTHPFYLRSLAVGGVQAEYSLPIT
jgi:hypothetical protein